MSALNLSTLAAAAKANDCELTLSQEGGTNFFTVGNEDMGHVEFSNYNEALAFLSDRKQLEAHRESALCNCDDFGLCPICGAEPTILNVGRNHYACCHEHKVYWAIGSNLFSSWRDEEPDVWEENKKLLATYQDRKDVPEQFEYVMYLDGLSNSEVLKAPSREEFYKNSTKQAKPKANRPPLGSLGDCLAETAKHQPHGYAKFIGCNQAFWRDIPADQADKPWFVMEGATAALDAAPVTIFICDGTTAAEARAILKGVSRWLKEHGDEMHDFTPQEPPATSGDDELPF